MRWCTPRPGAKPTAISTQIVVGDILFNLYRTLIHPFEKQNQSLALILRLFSDIKRHPRFIEAAKAFYALPLETCGKCSLVCGDPSGGTLARPGSPLAALQPATARSLNPAKTFSPNRFEF